MWPCGWIDLDRISTPGALKAAAQGTEALFLNSEIRPRDRISTPGALKAAAQGTDGLFLNSEIRPRDRISTPGALKAAALREGKGG